GRHGLGLGRPLAGRLALIVILGTIFALTSGFQLVETRRALYESGSAGKPSDPDVIASYIRSQPPGAILVWGNEAQIYALSGRDPVTPFLITEFTRTDSPRAATSRAQLLSDLAGRPPPVIVVDPHAAEEVDIQLSGFPELAQLLDRCYTRVPAMPASCAVYTPTALACPSNAANAPSS